MRYITRRLVNNSLLPIEIVSLLTIMVHIYHIRSVMAPVYSHSQLQTYQACPLRYRFEKIDAIPIEKVPSIPLSLGSAVHGALEKLYAYRRNLTIATKQELLSWFEDLWQQEVISMSENAAAQQQEIVFSEDELTQAAKRGEHYVQWYYDEYYPFDQAVTDSVEKNIVVDLGDDCRLRGKIDRFDINSTTAIVVDYKTSRSMPKDKDDTIKDQLALYGASIMQEYSDKFTRVVGRVIYLHLEREYEFEITQDVVEELKKKYITLIKEIESKRFHLNMGDEQAFPATPGRHCDTCPFKRLCPIYAHQYMDNETVSVAELGNTTIKDMIDKVYTLSQQSKAINDKKDFYLQMLKEYADKKGYLQRLRGSTAKLKIEKKKQYEPDKDMIDQLIAKLQELGVWDDLKKEDIDKKKLDIWLQNGQLDSSAVAGFVILKDKLTVGRPQLIKDNEQDEASNEMGK